MINDDDKDKIDTMLVAFNRPATTRDGDCLDFGNGLSMGIEERDFEHKSLTGSRVEQRTFYILYKEVVEYNYPHEPDTVDTVEGFAALDPLSVVAEMMKCELDEEIERYMESIMTADLFA